MIEKLCFFCMNEISSPEEVCPHCGHDNHIRDNGPGMLRSSVLAGKYVVGRLLGRGGFGATYIGFDTRLKRAVAIKEYLPGNLVVREGNSSILSVVTGGTDAFRKGCQRALNEGLMAAKLGQIPGIVQVYDVFGENNTVYIVMEYIEGDTLTEYVRQQPEKLSLTRAMELLQPVANALQILHEQKVIHRDVKPDNIMLRKIRQQGVLLDFGAARVQDETTLSNSSAVVSPGYAPPEQYNATSLDGRIDQYAFAATLYHALTGQRPPDVMMRIANGNALQPIRNFNPDVPAAAEKAIFKAMSIKASGRFHSMDEFWDALLIADGRKKKHRTEKVNEDPQPSGEHGEKRNSQKKNSIGLISGLAALAAALVLGILLFGGCKHKEWTEALCETPSACVSCGEVMGEPLGHKWVNADCEHPKTCSVCSAVEGVALGHEWTEADCEKPKTCVACAMTEGTALGHEWVNADCENPKTCSVCSAVEGVALGHQWTEADCETAKTCTVCKEIEGKALGHRWQEATCETPKTCSVCNATEGEKADHIWEKTGNNEKCVICNIVSSAQRGASFEVDPSIAVPEGYPLVAKGVDFGGAEVIIYDYWSYGDSSYGSKEERKYKEWLMKTYNVRIKQTQGGDWSTCAEEMHNFTASPDGSLRLYIIEPGKVGTLVGNGIAAPINYDFSDVTQWNASVTDMWTIGGQTYGMSMNAYADPRGCLFFNKRVLEEAGIDWNTIYDMQAQGTWTWDAFEKMLKTITKDTDNDGKNDIWGLTGSTDDMYVLSVFSNGGSFFDFDEEGKIQPTMNSDETIEALNWSKGLMEYFYSQPAGANWDYYKEAWKQGFCGFYAYQAYGGFNDYSEMSDMQDEWGCVAWPVPEAGMPYITVISENTVLIPNVYDEETVTKLAFLYDMWNNPVPGFDNEDDWIGNKYHYTDERAVDETYAMLRQSEHNRVNKVFLLGTQNDVLGPSLLWSIAGSDPAVLIEAGMPAWQALCDSFNSQ